MFIVVAFIFTFRFLDICYILFKQKERFKDLNHLETNDKKITYIADSHFEYATLISIKTDPLMVEELRIETRNRHLYPSISI